MKTKSRLLLTGALLGAALNFAAAASAKTVNITANDMLRFNVTRIDATPGETITVTLHNDGTVPKAVMGHNWVLLAPGETPEAYAAASASAAGQGYEPLDLKPKVLAEIPLLGPGESASVTFTAPKSPGTYTYMCSFPAHCAAGMRGELVVR